MNKNRNLKIVWTVCSVAVMLLFCTQAYWLYNQCQYNMEKSVEKFKEDCSRILKEDLKSKKQLVDKKAKKGNQHKWTARIETKYNLKTSPHCRTIISFWDGKQYLGTVDEPNITSDDAYEMYSRYVANLYYKPTAAYLESLLKKKAYSGICDFRHTKSKDLFLDVRYETNSTWTKKIVVYYQTNPIFHEGISFEVTISSATILKSMLWQLLGSILLFAVLACSLYYLIRTIVFQKRIDALRQEFLKNMIYEMKQPKSTGNADAVSIGSIVFSYAENELRKGNERVIITSRQAEILRLLANHQNQLVERETILNEVWGDDSYSNSLALNVQITYLRRALSIDASVSIEAVIKKGYILKVI